MQNIAKLNITLTALLLGTVLLSACGKGQDANGKPPQKEAEIGVITLKPETVTLSNELPGRVTPLQVAEVRPQVTGIIQERLFQEGSQVKKGTPLYQIDNATYQAAADTAAAQLAKAEATLSAARSKAQRGQGLAARGLISSDSHDDQLTEQKQAEADVAVAQAALKTRPYQPCLHAGEIPVGRFHRQIRRHRRRVSDR